MTKSKLDRREAIVDTAVAIAERSNWEAVRLFDVATELNISLDDIRAHFSKERIWLVPDPCV